MMRVLKLLSALLLLSPLPPGFSHVMNQFSDVPHCDGFFLDGITPDFPGILVNGIIQHQNRYKPICQFFNNTYRFATLYDTTNRIPVFSAYTFTGTGGRGRPRNQRWMIEPQLNVGDSKSMKTDPGKDLYELQAGNMDYNNSITINGVNRGHLFPSSHAPDEDTKRSTFTLTNIVPQAVTFNGGSWNKMENKVRDILQNQCIDNNDMIKAHVVTGAVPSVNNKLNKRVNIPSHMWTAYCCYNNNLKRWMSEAHWGENKQNSSTTNHTLAELYSWLGKQHNGVVKVFSDLCPTGVSTIPATTNPNTASTLLPPKAQNLFFFHTIIMVTMSTIQLV
ncbi:hypothetical protein UPYG_G00245200 [Umbra pygmaea]|uniref:Uncharacterized protein n=1 Tax=Umbra pygmaea TaxID=75934 RepID=A0ABD0X407_UMBPY